MTPKERAKSDRKVLFTVAGLVVAAVAGLILVANLGSDEPEPIVARRPVAPPIDTPAVFIPEAEEAESEPVEFKVPGSTVDPEIVESTEEFVIEPDENLVARGLECYGSRDFSRAAAYFEAHASEAPGDAWTRYMVGLSNWKAGELDRAAEAMQASIELNPASIKSKINLSRIQNDRGAFDEALAAAEAALELDGTSATALFLQGRSLRNLGRVEEAVQSLEQSLSIQDSGYVANLLGLTFIEQGSFESASEILSRAAMIEPDVAYIQNNLGMALERSGRRDEAIVAYRRATELNPQHDKAVLNLARLQPVEGVTPIAAEPAGVTVASATEAEVDDATEDDPSR